MGNGSSPCRGQHSVRIVNQLIQNDFKIRNSFFSSRVQLFTLHKLIVQSLGNDCVNQLMQRSDTGVSTQDDSVVRREIFTTRSLGINNYLNPKLLSQTYNTVCNVVSQVTFRERRCQELPEAFEIFQDHLTTCTFLPVLRVHPEHVLLLVSKLVFSDFLSFCFQSFSNSSRIFGIQRNTISDSRLPCTCHLINSELEPTQNIQILGDTVSQQLQRNVREDATNTFWVLQIQIIIISLDLLKMVNILKSSQERVDSLPCFQVSIRLNQFLKILNISGYSWNQNNKALKPVTIEVCQGNAVILSQTRNSILESSQNDGLSNFSVTNTSSQGICKILNFLTVIDHYTRVWADIKAQLFQHWNHPFLNLVHQTQNWILPDAV